MRYKVFLPIVMVMAMATAQQQTEGDGFGGPMVGGVYYKLEDLNSRLSNLGFGTFDNVQYIVGAKGYALIKQRVLIGGSGFGILGQTVNNDSVSAKLTGGAGFFDVGFALFASNNYSLIPVVGIGGAGISLDLAPRQRAEPLFDSVLVNPRRTAKLNAAGFALKLGLVNHFAWEVVSEQKNNVTSTFILGGSIEASLIFMPSMEWELENGIGVFNAPDPKNYMVMVGVTVLLGGRETRM